MYGFHVSKTNKPIGLYFHVQFKIKHNKNVTFLEQIMTRKIDNLQ